MILLFAKEQNFFSPISTFTKKTDAYSEALKNLSLNGGKSKCFDNPKMNIK